MDTKRFPNYCRHCGGWGYIQDVTYHPFGDTFAQEVTTTLCEALDHDQCHRCGKHALVDDECTECGWSFDDGLRPGQAEEE